ncbi:hypothetical protein D9M72_646680 [compost metagenome]
MFFEHLELPADSPMGHVQLLGRLTDAVETGGCFKRPQRIEGRKVSAHVICEFS